MDTLNNRLDGAQSQLVSLMKGIGFCLLMAGAVLVGSGMNRPDAIAADAAPAATAPVAADEAWTSGYFPATFPVPASAPEPLIEQF
jgi:hypothetical protein